MAAINPSDAQSANEYDDRTAAAVKAVLLEIGQIPGSFKGKFAVVGGAVPWLLLDNFEMPHVGTIDVDLGLDAEALGDGEYVRLIDALMTHGYGQNKKLKKFQLVRRIEATDGGDPIDIVVDFLMPRDAEIDRNKPPIIEDFAVQRADGTDDDETTAPPVRSIRDELRRHGVRKTFVHQFRLLAEHVAARIIPRLQPPKKWKKGDGEDPHWKRSTSFQKKPKPKPELERPEPPPPVVADLEADEHRTAEEVTRPATRRPAIWQSGPLCFPFNLDRSLYLPRSRSRARLTRRYKSASSTVSHFANEIVVTMTLPRQRCQLRP